jgi:uncharacterized protein
MKLLLFDTLESRFRIEEATTSGALGLEHDPFAGDEQVNVVCNCHRDGDVAVVECVATVSLAQSCSRCLKDMASELSTPFTIVVRRLNAGEHQPEASEEDELLERDDDVRFLSHDESTVDITEVVHDALLLAVTEKPLCSADCRGICPQCGVNLNESTCECTTDRTDSRWGDLKGLFEGED